MLQSIIYPYSTCHLIITIIKTSIAIYLSISHTAWKSLSICIINCSKSLSLSFIKLSLIFYPVLRILIEISHIYFTCIYLQIMRSTKSIVKAISPWTTIHNLSLRTIKNTISLKNITILNFPLIIIPIL